MYNDELEFAVPKTLDCYEETVQSLFKLGGAKGRGLWMGTAFVSIWERCSRNFLGDVGEDHFSRERGAMDADGIRTPARTN
jgi:hypothetical protein